MRHRRSTALILAAWLAGATLPALGAAQTEETVTIQAENASLREILSGIARLGGYNLIIPADLERKVNVRLRDVTPQEALAGVAAAADLVIEEQGNLRIVRAETTENAPRISEIFTLQHAAPEEVEESLSAVLPAEHIRAHTASNTVVVYGQPRELAAARQIVAMLDQAQQQVKVEVEVIAVRREKMKELGIDWDWQSLTGSPRHTRTTWTESEPRHDADGNPLYDAEGHLLTKEVQHSGWRVEAPEGFGAIRFGRTVGGFPYAFFFRAQLKAMLAQGDAKIIARPNIVTLNGREAKILIGDRIPVQTEQVVNGAKVVTTEYRDAGIRLLYTPQVNEDGDITAHIHAEVATPYLVPEMHAYRIMTREAETTVRVHDGETLTVGGLIDRAWQENERRVPILSDIPLLGHLFRSKTKTAGEAEIIIAIRAELVTPERTHTIHEEQRSGPDGKYSRHRSVESIRQ